MVFQRLERPDTTRYLDQTARWLQNRVYVQTKFQCGGQTGYVLPFSVCREIVYEKISRPRKYNPEYFTALDDMLDYALRYIRTWERWGASATSMNRTYGGYDPMDLKHFHRCTGIKAYPKIKRKRRPLNPHFVMSSLWV